MKHQYDYGETLLIHLRQGHYVSTLVCLLVGLCVCLNDSRLLKKLGLNFFVNVLEGLGLRTRITSVTTSMARNSLSC